LFDEPAQSRDSSQHGTRCLLFQQQANGLEGHHLEAAFAEPRPRHREAQFAVEVDDLDSGEATTSDLMAASPTSISDRRPCRGSFEIEG
jgi:hypothetical protein